jgi:hypothetical protein
MLDRKGSEGIVRRAPVEWTHREIVGTGLVSSELLIKVGEGVKEVPTEEAFLIFPVAALDLAVVPGCIGRISLWRMPRAAAVISKSVWDSRFEGEKRLVNSKSLSVCTHTPALEPFDHTGQEIGGGIGALLWIPSSFDLNTPIITPPDLRLSACQSTPTFAA